MSKYRFLNDIRWHFFHIRPRTPFCVHFWTYGLAHPSADIRGFDYSVRYDGHFENKVIIDEETFQRQRKELLQRLASEPEFLLNMLADFYQKFEKILAVWRGIFAQRVEDAKPGQLIRWLREFFDSMVVFDAYLLFPLYVEHDLSEELHTTLTERFPPADAERFYAAAITPTKEGLNTRELRSLLQVALIMKRDEEYQPALKKHTEQFCWMLNKHYTMDFYDEEFYLQRARELAAKDPQAELEKLDGMRAQITTASQEAEQAIGDDPRLLALFRTLQESVYFRSFRGEEMYHSSYYLRPMFREIAQHLRVTEKEVVYLTAFEMIELLESGKKADKREIAERMKGFALLTNVSDGKVISGKELAEARNFLHIEEAAETSVTVLQGTKAYGGKAVGRACVVRSLAELRKVTGGCILITHSTTPEYVPSLGNVAAIVTEEGGVLSHAMIISREMKISCVIGTKIATKVFKDGDTIEVDADKGTVKRV